MIAFLLRHWKLFIVAILLYSLYNCGHSAGHDEAVVQCNADKQDIVAAAEKQNREFREKEAKLEEKTLEVSNELETRLEQARNTANTALAHANRDNVRLRDKFRACNASRMSEASQTTAPDDGETGTGFSRVDEEFLIRLAERADSISHRLTACQEYVRQNFN